MEVIAPEAKVRIGTNKDIDGIVCQVCIRPRGQVQYLVSWWDETTYKTSWLEDFEVCHFTDTEKRSIGFRL